MGGTKGTKRDTVTFDPSDLELTRNLTAWFHHNGHPGYTKGRVIGLAVRELAERVCSEHGMDKVPDYPDYDLRYGERLKDGSV